MMRTMLLAAAAVVTLIAVPSVVRAQVPDLSGVYMVRDFRGPLAQMSPEVKGEAPFVPAAGERYKALVARRATAKDYASEESPSGRCLPPGISFLMTAPYPMQVIQAKDMVLTYHEFGNFVRRIYLNRKDHGDPDPSWLGHSIGRYEGDTLVVDTVGFNGKAWLDSTGLQASDALHTVERFRRVNNELEYKITLEDPKTFTRPWTAEAHFRPQTYDINEFVCLENNKVLNQKN